MANPKKMGRPQIKLDWEQMDKLLVLQCTQNEIASWFDCSPDTLERACKREHGVTFADYSKQKRQKGCISLRRRQFEIAMSGNVAMLIWLGKQYLEQADKVVTENENIYTPSTHFSEET